MEKKDTPNGKENGDVSDSGRSPVKQSKAEFRLGDMVWIKLRGGSWWPAQIVDEKTVSGIWKPRKKRSADVLVRLYGTYEYLYRNPVTSLLEFNDVLEQSKCSERQFFMKALNQDLSKLQGRRKNVRKAKAKGDGCADMENTTPSKRAIENEDGLKRKCKPGFDTPEKPEVSARRLKVMQDLGLTAPSGSPYQKNGRVLSIVQ